MEILGLGKCFDETPVGYRFRTINRTITETDLVNFINVTGMTEVLFTDVEYVSKHGPQGGRLVPGALVYSMAEGLIMQGVIQGTGLAFLGTDMDVKGPTFVGDTIHVEAEVIECRPTSKDPRKGLVRTRNQIVNQHGVTVIEYTPLRMAAGTELLKEHWGQ